MEMIFSSMSPVSVVWCFFDEFGFKIAVTVAGDGDFHIAEAAGNGLLGMPITAVISGFITVIVFAVTKLVFKLAFKAIL